MNATEENAVVIVDTTKQYLNIFLLSPVIIIGLVGNVLSMLTWSRGCHRDTSTAALLTALAIMDTVVLTMPALEYWTLNVFGVWLRRSHIFVCKTLGFASYFGPSCSSWIVVVVTVERLVSIWFPMKIRIVVTRTKVCVCLVIVSLLLTAIYSPFLVETRMFYSNTLNQTVCDWDDNGNFYKHYYTVWMWLDLCMLFMLPFILIVVANSLILYKLLQSRRIHIRQGHYMSYRTRVANAFTIRAIALSIAVLVCLFPITTFEVYIAHTRLPDYNAVLYVVSHILLYANSALNFILYCVIGTGFRTDMKTVLTNLCSRKKVRLDQDLNTNSSHFHSLLAHRTTNTKC